MPSKLGHTLPIADAAPVDSFIYGIELTGWLASVGILELPPLQILTTSQLLDKGDGLGIFIFTIKGILKPRPNPKQVPDCKDFCFSTISSVMLGTILRIYSTSTGWFILNIKKLVHWEITVSDISTGLCEISPRITPYLRPSLAILSNIL